MEKVYDWLMEQRAGPLAGLFGCEELWYHTDCSMSLLYSPKFGRGRNHSIGDVVIEKDFVIEGSDIVGGKDFRVLVVVKDRKYVLPTDVTERDFNGLVFMTQEGVRPIEQYRQQIDLSDIV